MFASGHARDELAEALTESYALYVKEGRGVVTIGPTQSEGPGVAEIKLRVPTPACTSLSNGAGSTGSH